jgi:hypothetical protein
LIRILVTFASLESATISLRMKTRNRQAAFAGRPPLGRRGYGLDRGRESLVAEEVDRVREAAGRILSGDTPDEIVRDWNRRGVPSPDGGRWWDTTLITILTSARIAGNRTYHGELAATGCMPAVLDAVTAARVAALLADRHRRKLFVTRHRPLGGIVRCDRCGFLLTWSGPRPKYACGAINGCRSIAVSAPSLEGHLEQRLHARATAGARGRQPLGDAETLELLSTIRSRFQAIPYVVGDGLRQEVERQRADLLDDYRRTEPPDETPFYGRRLATVWPRLTAEERRRQFQRYVKRVVVGVATTRGGKFGADRVSIQWW